MTVWDVRGRRDNPWLIRDDRGTYSSMVDGVIAITLSCIHLFLVPCRGGRRHVGGPTNNNPAQLRVAM